MMMMMILPIDGAKSGHSGPRSNGNEGVLDIP